MPKIEWSKENILNIAKKYECITSKAYMQFADFYCLKNKKTYDGWIEKIYVDTNDAMIVCCLHNEEGLISKELMPLKCVIDENWKDEFRMQDGIIKNYVHYSSAPIYTDGEFIINKTYEVSYIKNNESRCVVFSSLDKDMADEQIHDATVMMDKRKYNY